MQPASYWINHLKLLPHPEGGFYKETYRAAETIGHAALPSRFGASRSISTAIYFLLRAEEKSLFHRIKSDELWHFHAGDSLTIYVLGAQGLVKHQLGTDLELGDKPQIVIPANHWFGACVEKGSYTLSSCTVAPGFDFQDFEMADGTALRKEFPHHQEIITRLTPDK